MGRSLTVVAEATGARVAFVTRFGAAELPRPGMALQENDVLHVLVRSVDVADVERILTHAPTEEV